MKTVLALSMLAATLSVTACKSGEKTTADTKASGTATVNTASKTQIGGQVVPVGKHRVEVRVFKNGYAEGIVLDANGAALADLAKAKLVLRAKAKAKADAPVPIELAYDPILARLTGRAGAGVELEPGPIDVELRLGDANATAKLEAPVLLVGPELGGTLLVAGKYGVELAVRANGAIEAVVHDAAGVRLSADPKLALELAVGANAKASNTVRLAWDAPRAMFTGAADAAASVATGPIDVRIDGAAVAQLPRLAVYADAKHGGQVVLVGDYAVELVANGNAVSAFVFDATGAASAKADLDLSLQAGGGTYVKLAWDAPSLSYRANFREQIDFSVAPIALALKADGKVFVGARAPSAKFEANAKLAAAAKADVHGKAGLDAKANVKAPTLKAQADVKAPKVDVNKTASATAGTNGKTGASAKAQAGFSFGTR